MITQAFLYLALSGSIAAGPDDAPAFNPPAATTQTESDLRVYNELKAAARSSEAHVRLALWCEARGLSAERLKQLAVAVLRDPNNAAARGLLGFVAVNGKWRRPDAVPRQVADDPKLAAALREYQVKRGKTPYQADPQWKLALWCEQNGLPKEAVAHLRAVTKLDPKREGAWIRLGYKKHAGRWTTPAQIEADKLEIAAQKQADKHWKAFLEKHAEMLRSKSPEKRDEAEKALWTVTDPRAVPMIVAVFGRRDVAGQLTAIRLLGQIDAQNASRALATAAVFGASNEVRRNAAETLRPRDPREFAGMLVALLRDPIKYEIKPVGGPNSPGELLIEGKKVNLARKYRPPTFPLEQIQRIVATGGIWSTDANGLPVFIPSAGSSGYLAPDGSFQVYGPLAWSLQTQNQPSAFVSNAAPAQGGRPQSGSPTIFNAPPGVPGFVGSASGANALSLMTTLQNTEPIYVGEAVVEARQAAVAAERQMLRDAAELDRYNAAAASMNERAGSVLSTATGQPFTGDLETWRKWLVDLHGYAFMQDSGQPVPTIVQEVPLDFAVPAIAGIMSNPGGFAGHSCFAAGTLVRTLVGEVKIEAVRPGDLVLSQNTATGTLDYQPVVAVYHNPPNDTLKVTLDDGAGVVATGIHRFWKAGVGWTMARELKPGDVLRTLGGTTRVASVEKHKRQPVFNLEVASGSSFLVGKAGLLVHDNSVVAPELKPFDAYPEVASARRP